MLLLAGPRHQDESAILGEVCFYALPASAVDDQVVPQQRPWPAGIAPDDAYLEITYDRRDHRLARHHSSSLDTVNPIRSIVLTVSIEFGEVVSDGTELTGRLIAAALELLEGQPVKQLRIGEVAQKVGVSHQAPYVHFGDKRRFRAAVAGAEVETGRGRRGPPR